MRQQLLGIAALAAGFAPAAHAAEHVFTNDELLAIAGDKYASGELPLGDGHYVTDAPRKGYIYLCHPMNGRDGGAQRAGGWIHGDSWNLLSKIFVQGSVRWSDATFSNVLEGDERILSGNGLPLSHATGIFPVQQSDPAYAYDRNPNTIFAQSLRDVLPAHPTYSGTPYCMGGEVGIMLTGVPLFNGFDAGMRDAQAHEIQDSCSGHPQRSGMYHYHGLSACMKDIGVQTVLGYALDGFAITGPQVAAGKYLTTADLDECHGITSEIVEDGQKKVSYHYVMTQDFPYSVSCFRAQPVRTGPSDGGPRQQQQGMRRGPPPEALAACEGKNNGDACVFTSPRGDTVAGSCMSPPGRPLACAPQR